jgi:transcriptional regulator with XRE-family HTH domain
MKLQSNNHLRRRGTILTAQGLRKLNQAKAEVEIKQNFKRYTLETISEQTGLTPNTLSKVFTGSVGVDKQTLECCFKGFNLTLLKDDYLYLKPHQDRSNLAEIGSISPTETGCPIESVCDSPSETVCDRTNPSQTRKMERPQDNQQPHSPTPPGGQMPLDSAFYIDRPILESLCYQAIEQPGASINICAPKQMGKTSLITRILAHAKTLGYHTVSVSLQLADAEILQNLERFLQWFCARVSKQLDCPNSIANFWDNSLGSKSNATDYFEDVILANLDHEAWAAPNCTASLRENRPLLIAIDELSQLFAYPDIATEFLQLLRTWSEQAKEDDADINPGHKLRLVTVHSTEILMSPSINPSVLNTGLVIELPEFTLAQVQDLAERWEQEITAPQIQRLIALLGGHPYRLQLAFFSLQQQRITLEELLENSAIAAAIYADHLHQQWWNLQRYPDLLPSFTEIVRQSSPVDCEAVQASQLHKMGLVHLHGTKASLACEVLRPFLGDRLRQINR